MKLRILALILCLLLTACSSSTDLATSVSVDPARTDFAAFSPELSQAVTTFSFELLQNSLTEDANTLLSPPSVLSGLTMTANGAIAEDLTFDGSQADFSGIDANTPLFISSVLHKTFISVTEMEQKHLQPPEC